MGWDRMRTKDAEARGGRYVCSGSRTHVAQELIIRLAAVDLRRT